MLAQWNEQANYRRCFQSHQLPVGVPCAKFNVCSEEPARYASGIVGLPLSTPYGSAKAGLIVFKKVMAIELARSGERFNCVGPG